ncbi:hypothetical protein GGX14DRAFT_701785 [Mycena pura]|uniref:F-box domain-containing protein n=1 Tax=Mycena pura TaxID=153505 RepID=A0AAD6URG1_9AGAR|nr:hypothetical protein GGX14DRAFT_701785 [Mycena pura]
MSPPTGQISVSAKLERPQRPGWGMHAPPRRRRAPCPSPHPLAVTPTTMQPPFSGHPPSLLATPPQPHSPLIALPVELLELVAFHLATCRPNLGPPTTLLPLLATCRAVHTRLAAATNPALWAAIARAKLVLSPAFFELCPPAALAAAEPWRRARARGRGKGRVARDVAALRTACAALAVIRAGDPHHRAAGTALLVAYALLVADGGARGGVGKNRSQLAWAGARAFALRFVRARLWVGRYGDRDPPSMGAHEPAVDEVFRDREDGFRERNDGPDGFRDREDDSDTSDSLSVDLLRDAHTGLNSFDEWRAEWRNPVWRVGWPRDTRVAAAALWVLWFFESKDTLAAEPEALRQHIMALLLPFVCAPFRYASALAPPHHYSVPLLPGVLAGAGTGAGGAITVPTFHGPYPIYPHGAPGAGVRASAGAGPRARRGAPLGRAQRGGARALGRLLCAPPARLLFFARMQSRMGVPPHLPRDRADAEARWRTAGNVGPMPVGPTQADIHEKNVRPVVRFEPQLPAAFAPAPASASVPAPTTHIPRPLTFAEAERVGAVDPGDADADEPAPDARWAHHRWGARLCGRYDGRGMWDDGRMAGAGAAPAPAPTTRARWRGRGGAPPGRIGQVYELGSFEGLWAGTMLVPSEPHYNALVGTPGGALPPGGLARDDFMATARPVYMRIAEHWSFHPQTPVPAPAADTTTGDEGLRTGWLPPHTRVVSTGGGQIEVRVPAVDARRGGEDAHVYETVLQGRVLRDGAHDIERCPGCARAGKRARWARERERTTGGCDEEGEIGGEDTDGSGSPAETLPSPGSSSPSRSPTTPDIDPAAWPEWDAHRRHFGHSDDDCERGCDGVQDVVFTGATDPAHGQAWHHYEFAGRVRPWDGLVGLVMRPRDSMLGLATYFISGHLVGRDTFEGTWQMATQDVLAPSWGGSLCLSRGE